jgi:hypothetical protein
VTAVPVTTTIPVGKLRAAVVRANILDVLDFLQNKPAAELRQTVAQSIPNGALTALTFTTEDLDDDPAGSGGHSTSVNTTRFTAVYAGWYLIGGVVAFTASAVGTRATAWAVNGTNVNSSSVLVSASSAFGARIPAPSMRVFLNVGDYVELLAFQSTGGALNTEVAGEAASRMSIAWDRLA